jgi:hypothetical protein
MTIPTLDDLPDDVRALIKSESWQEAFVLWFGRIACDDPGLWLIALMKLKMEMDDPQFARFWPRHSGCADE